MALVVALVVIIPGATYAISRAQPRRYTATATVQINGPGVSAATFVPDLVAPEAPEQSIAGAVALMASKQVAAAAATQLSPPSAGSALLAHTTVTSDANKALVRVTATEPSGVRAALVANAVANAFLKVRTDRAKRAISSGIGNLVAQRAALPASATAESLRLTAELARLRTLLAGEASDANLVTSATQPRSAVSPRPVRNAALALSGMIVLALLLLFVLYIRDDRLRQPDELEKLTGRALIGALPTGTSYRTTMRNLNVKLGFETLALAIARLAPRTILVTSPLQGDGKTTVAIGVAWALASTGREIILVDGDLRTRDMSSLVSDDPDVGFGDAIARAVDPRDLLAVPKTGPGRLQLLPAGRTDMTPDQLFRSERVRVVLAALSEHADLVVVDGPECIGMMDAVLLSRRTSYTILVGRIARTPRSSLQVAAATLINLSGADIFCVANGVGKHDLLAQRGGPPPPAMEAEALRPERIGATHP